MKDKLRNDTRRRPSFRAALRFWCKLRWINGGATAPIAIIHDELVEKRWISNRNFLHALSYCMILSGPEAQQLAIYVGWRLHGNRGGWHRVRFYSVFRGLLTGHTPVCPKLCHAFKNVKSALK